MYRVGFPLWKTAARCGFAVGLRVRVFHDDQAKVYFADSPDLDGLIVEAKTLDDLRNEVRGAAEVLLDLADDHGSRIKIMPELRFKDDALCAA